MDKTETAEAMGLLSMLFEAFPTYGDKNSETMAKAYLVAIDGCSLVALREAVRRFIRGEVDEHNGKSIPTTALLARAVRYEDGRIRIEAAAAGRKRIDRAKTENVVELDAETRARRKKQLDELAIKLQSLG